MKPAQILISFAKQREQAYRSYGCLEADKLNAISRIKKVSNIFINSTKKGWINQIKPEIIKILPSEESAQIKTREKILNLLEQI